MHPRTRAWERQRAIGRAMGLGSRFRRKVWTYLIEIPEIAMVKIGVSVNPQNRLATVRTGVPFEVRLAGKLLGDRESALHRRFAAHRVRGEWFRDVPEIRAAFTPQGKS